MLLNFHAHSDKSAYRYELGLILAAILLKEFITSKKAIGVMVGLIGVIVIFFGGQDLSVIFKTRYFLGNALMLLNIICFGIFSIYSKVLTQKYGPLEVTTVIYIFGAILLLPIVLTTQDISVIAQLTLSSWLIVIFLGVFCSGIAYLLWIYGLKSVEVSKASAFIYLLPVGAILFSVLLLGENITQYLILGTGLILIGVFLVESNISKGQIKMHKINV